MPALLATVVLLLLVLAAWNLRTLWQQPPPPAPAAKLAPAPPPASLSPAAPITRRAEPAQLSLEQMLSRPSAAGEWQLARLRSNPAVLVIEFPTLLEQGLALNRAAAFIEKKHSAGASVLSDAELQSLVERSGDSVATFYFGHDYRAEQLAQFYARAAQQGLRLNAQEQRLQAMLQEQGVLASAASPARPGSQALVSFTAAQAADSGAPEAERVDALRRESTLIHELSHGEFFTNADYQRRCWAFWRALSEAERARFRQLLSSMDYDPSNEELMVNETQALLMHTPDRRAFDAASLGLNEAQLQKLRQRFRAQP